MDKIWDYYELGHAFKSRAPTVFYFSTQNYFTISFKFLDFLRLLDQFELLIRVIISEFYMAWREKLTKIFYWFTGWTVTKQKLYFRNFENLIKFLIHVYGRNLVRLQISVISAMFLFYIWIIEKVEKRISKAVKGLQFKILICRMNTLDLSWV